MARKASYDRDEVLQKALELFWAKGYHATSLKDLEVALDMRPGSIYAAFGSKEALFAETLKLYAERSQAQFDRTIAEAPTPLAGLAAHVRALGCPPEGKAPPSRACMLVKTLLETPDDDPGLRRLTEERMREIEAGFASAFRAARDAGQIAADTDPDRLARRLQAAVFGLRAYAQRRDAGAGVAELAADIARDLEALAVR
ncbi:TetR/AcrR family transcriptional regulator [Pseudodonghicola sp.]|uniref:TetR/AcrR family transcriptional regulator n=1 Tax=Pseudodonghicola sp. TaxID=1969463 RepID=UPI003A972DAF